jgi:hypothetical protein
MVRDLLSFFASSNTFDYSGAESMSHELDAKKVKQRLDAAEEKQEIKNSQGKEKLREKVQATKNGGPTTTGSVPRAPDRRT